MAKKGKVVWGRLPLAMHLVGLSSAACIVWAVWSLLQIYGVFGLPDVREPAKLAKSTKPTASSKPSTAVAESATPQSTQATPASHYPLEVGRYWVYRSEDQIHGVITEVERRIERKEWREEREVFVFSDGSLAYRQDGKIFEVGGSGVNVVLLEAETSGGLLIALPEEEAEDALAELKETGHAAARIGLVAEGQGIVVD